ncbi:MAG: M20/M25/M40 family metallo-hydrolase [Firmicutes bacterium]|nr:M20/M25/M40 family metallo-hydrolase [Bacillota bacterium]
MSDRSDIKEYFEREQTNILKDLAELIAIRSRSVERENCEKALDLVLGRAREMGFETRKGKYGDVGTVVFGEGEETIGILVHVDVVPEGNVENWHTDPFKLSLVDGHLYGRGVVDDKGPVIISLYALKYLKDRGEPLRKKIMLIVGTREEIVWEDMNHFKEEFPLPDYGFSPDGAFPIYNRENGYMDVELIFNEPLLKGDEDITGGSATNSIPAKAHAVIDGEYTEYIGKNAHSSVPFMGLNAVALMLEDLAERTDYGFAKFMAKYFPEKAYHSNLEFRMKDGTLKNDENTVMVPTMIWQEGQKITVSINVRNDFKLPSASILETLEEKRSEGKYDIHPVEILESIWVDEDLPWIQSMKNVLKANGLSGECLFAPGCTYAKSIPNTVCFGPVFEGDRDCAHMDNEGQSLEHYIWSGEIITEYLAAETL